MSYATLDQPVTYRELDQMYGTDKTHTTRKLIIETITQTVRKVSHKVLSVPYVKTNTNGSAAIAAYSLAEVFKDYSSEPDALAALMAVIEKSDCLLVAEFRKQIAKRFADDYAYEVDEVCNE